MGAKLTKTKDTSFSDECKDQLEKIAIDSHADNHIDRTKIENNKQVNGKEVKKKKETKSNKKSSTTKQDKSTLTDNCVPSLSKIIEQEPINDQSMAVNHDETSHTCTTEINTVSQIEASNSDAQELQNNCNREVISSDETHDTIEQTSSEQEHSANKLNTDQESSNNASIVVDGNSNQVNSED